MKLNPDFEIKVRDPEEEQVLLKNRRNETIITMSEIEYDMLCIFAETDDVMDIIDKYGKEYDIDYAFIKALIGHGLRLKIIVQDDYVSKESMALLKLRTAITRIFQVLGLIKLGLHVELTGGYKLFKLISIDLKGKWIERTLSKPSGQRFSILAYFVLLVASVVYFFVAYHSGGLNWGFDADLGILGIFIGVFLGILILSFLHEAGHYVLYKKYGGHSNEMGIATSNLVLPIFYTSTYTMHFWKRKKHKLIVTLAGVLMDLLLLFLMLDINLMTGLDAIKFFSLIFAFFMVVRLVGNLNPLIPGTDGYFLVVDAFGLQNLLNQLNTNFIEMLRNFKEKKFKAFKMLRRKHLYATLYAVITFAMITAYWLLIIYLLFMAVVSF